MYRMERHIRREHRQSRSSSQLAAKLSSYHHRTIVVPSDGTKHLQNENGARLSIRPNSSQNHAKVLTPKRKRGRTGAAPLVWFWRGEPGVVRPSRAECRRRVHETGGCFRRLTSSNPPVQILIFPFCVLFIGVPPATQTYVCPDSTSPTLIPNLPKFVLPIQLTHPPVLFDVD